MACAQSEPLLSEETATIVLKELRRRTHHLGLLPQDQDDLIARVVFWILQHRDPRQVVTGRWLDAVIGTFGRRESRRRFSGVEEPLDDVQAPKAIVEGFQDHTVLFRELNGWLSESERRTMKCRLRGETWRASMLAAGVRPSNHSKWLRRFRLRVSTLLGWPIAPR